MDAVDQAIIIAMSASAVVGDEEIITVAIIRSKKYPTTSIQTFTSVNANVEVYV